MHEAQYLNRHGVSCTINRSPSVSAKVSIKHSTRGTNYGLRESAYEGWIDTLMTVGETFTVGSSVYLIHALETLSDAYEFTARKCNSLITLLSLTVTEDEYGNMIQTFADIVTDQDCYGQIVTASLRETDPGLLPTTVRIYTIPEVSVKVLDRLIHQCAQQQAIDMGAVYDSTYGGARFKVDSIDDILIPGLKRIQVSPDTRETEEAT